MQLFEERRSSILGKYAKWVHIFPRTVIKQCQRGQVGDLKGLRCSSIEHMLHEYWNILYTAGVLPSDGAVRAKSFRLPDLLSILRDEIDVLVDTLRRDAYCQTCFGVVKRHQGVEVRRALQTAIKFVDTGLEAFGEVCLFCLKADGAMIAVEKCELHI